MKIGTWDEVVDWLVERMWSDDASRALVVTNGMDGEALLRCVAAEWALGRGSAWRLLRNLFPRAEREVVERCIAEKLPLVRTRVRTVQELEMPRPDETLFVVACRCHQMADFLDETWHRMDHSAEGTIEAFNRAYGGFVRADSPTDLETMTRPIAAVEAVLGDPRPLKILAPEQLEDAPQPFMCGFMAFLKWYLFLHQECAEPLIRRIVAIGDEDFQVFKTWFVAANMEEGGFGASRVFFPRGEAGGAIVREQRPGDLFEMDYPDYANELYHVVRSLGLENNLTLFAENMRLLRRSSFMRDIGQQIDENGHDALWYLFASRLEPAIRAAVAEVLCRVFRFDRNRVDSWGLTWQAVHDVHERIWKNEHGCVMAR